jgi:hypothetical protein
VVSILILMLCVREYIEEVDSRVDDLCVWVDPFLIASRLLLSTPGTIAMELIDDVCGSVVCVKCVDLVFV